MHVKPYKPMHVKLYESMHGTLYRPMHVTNQLVSESIFIFYNE